MGSLNRIFDLAAKALDSSGSSSSARGGSRDWRSMVRDVAGAVTGDGKPAAPLPLRTDGCRTPRSRRLTTPRRASG